MSSPQVLPLTQPSAVASLPSRGVRRALFASSAKVSLFQCLGVLLGFGFQAFVSRACGADALGAVTLFLSWLGILSVLTIPGLEGSLVYFLPRLEEDGPAIRRILRQCLAVAVAASFLVTAAVALAGPRWFARLGLPAQARPFLCIALLAYSVGKLLDAAFLGFKDAPAQGYFNNIRTVARFLLCLPVLLVPSARWPILFAAVAGECLFSLLWRILRMRRRYPLLAGLAPIPRCGPIASRRALAAIALPMLGVSIIDTVYPLLDKAVLGVMVPLAMLGIYRIGDAVASVNSMFVSPFVAFWPYISQLHGQKRLYDLRDAYRTITLFIIVVMMPFALLLVELSPTVLSLFGPAFVSQGRDIFLVLALGTAIDAVAGPAGAVLKLTGHARASLTINTAWLALYLGLTILLTRHYGILGAAIGKMIATILGNLANLTANRLLLGVFPYTAKHALLLLAAAAVLAARWSLLPAHLRIAGQCLAGSLQAIALLSISALILNREIRSLLPQIQLWMQGRLSTDAAH